MPMPIKISPAEWEVLDVLWDRAPATAAEVYDALPRDKEWHAKTVNTFLARLVEKGVLQVRRDGRSNVYIPRKTREQCVEAEGEFFLKRVFRGAFARCSCTLLRRPIYRLARFANWSACSGKEKEMSALTSLWNLLCTASPSRRRADSRRSHPSLASARPSSCAMLPLPLGAGCHSPAPPRRSWQRHEYFQFTARSTHGFHY
jgi:BlaI family penicillinase repressor